MQFHYLIMHYINLCHQPIYRLIRTRINVCSAADRSKKKKPSYRIFLVIFPPLLSKPRQTPVFSNAKCAFGPNKCCNKSSSAYWDFIKSVYLMSFFLTLALSLFICFISYKLHGVQGLLLSPHSSFTLYMLRYKSVILQPN